MGKSPCLKVYGMMVLELFTAPCMIPFKTYIIAQLKHKYNHVVHTSMTSYLIIEQCTKYRV